MKRSAVRSSRPAVAAGQTVAADPQLARRAHRHGLAVAIEDVDRGVGDRPPDRQRLAAGGHPLAGRPDRRLGRAVHIPQLDPGVEQPVRQRHRQRLTAAQCLQRAGRAPTASRAASATWWASPASPSRPTAPGARPAPADRRWSGRVATTSRAALEQRQVQLQPGDVEGQRGDRDQHILGDRAPAAAPSWSGSSPAPGAGSARPWAARWSPTCRSRKPAARDATLHPGRIGRPAR